MERNDVGTEGFADKVGQPEANEFSGSSTTPQPENRSDFAASEPVSQTPQGIRDRAKNALGTAGDRVKDFGSTARERVGTAKDKLANALESGAERLRDRGHGGPTLAGATAEGTTTTVQGDGKVAQVSDRVAGGMEATADWLRTADIDSLKSGIENQVKEHPGRTLLIAAGLGYLIGRAFRGNSNT
jgi:ElaB/YqjD/DUF883 family membrane-anchored ribosome-binding protein